MCFDQSGVHQRSSGLVEPLGWDSIAIANLDQSGPPEIVVRRQALTSVGAALWTGGVVFFGPSPGGTSIAADVDANGSMDVLAGRTAYSSSGATLYTSATLNDGHCAVANFDSDPQAEIVQVYQGNLRLLEHDLTLKWGPISLPNGGGGTGNGSPPTIADFDGDGAAELVYRSEIRLRVFRGTDGDAEIVCPANNNCFAALGNHRGLYAFEGSTDSWQPTRRVWNQHTYHVTNVEEDGRIPTSEPRPWQTPALASYNSMRQNLVRPLAAPNLVPSRLSVTFGPPDTITARVGNGGGAIGQSGESVAFYSGPPSTGGALLGLATTTSFLEPGEIEDVAIAVAACALGGTPAPQL